MPKVVNGFSWTFVCKMGVGPRTNLYNIGGDPLTQLILVINFNFLIFFSSKCVDKLTVRKWTEKDFGGDPLTHLCNQSNIPA